MKGPLNVIHRRRSERHTSETDTAQATTEAPTEVQPGVDGGAAGAGATAPGAAGADAAGPAEAGVPGAGAAGSAAAATSQPPPGNESPTDEQPTAAVPAGQDSIPERPSFRQRGRLRRRLRYLRRIRELGFRDLGGLVFDQHKFARLNEELVRGKLTALAAVDAELRALEHALDDRRPLTELREPGISVCPRCGALHGSDARYCPSCGVPVRGPRAIAEVGEAVSLSPQPPPSAQPPAQLTLRSEPPPAAPEPEPQPAVTEVAEREAAKAEAEAARTTQQPTEVMRPVDDQASDGAPGAVVQPGSERREP